LGTGLAGGLCSHLADCKSSAGLPQLAIDTALQAWLGAWLLAHALLLWR